MKDYFAALASRVLQPDRSVQPRPRAPFAGAGAAAVDVQDPFVSVEQPAAGTRAPRRNSVERGVAADTASPRAETARTSAAGAQAHDTLPQHEPATRRRANAGRPDPVAFFVHPTIAAPLSMARSKEGASLSAASTRHEVPSRNGAPARAMNGDVPRSVSTSSRADTRRETSPAEPVITIHIGRVDVRAVQAPPVQTQAETRSEDARRGLMTLDEYVRQRTGERS